MELSSFNNVRYELERYLEDKQGWTNINMGYLSINIKKETPRMYKLLIEEGVEGNYPERKQLVSVFKKEIEGKDENQVKALILNKIE